MCLYVHLAHRGTWWSKGVTKGVFHHTLGMDTLHMLNAFTENEAFSGSLSSLCVEQQFPCANRSGCAKSQAVGDGIS